MYDVISLHLRTQTRDTAGDDPRLPLANFGVKVIRHDVADTDVAAVAGEMLYEAARPFPRSLAVLASAVQHCHLLDGGPQDDSPQAQAEHALAAAALQLLETYDTLDTQRSRKQCA